MKILVCKPNYFDVSYSINPWMNPDKNAVDKSLAYQQWQNLIDLMRSLGAEVVEMDGHPDLPDLVFTANAGLFFINSRTCVLSNFTHPERQPEREVYKKWFEDNGYIVHQLADNILFEGAGDALFKDSTCFAKENKLYIGYGFRSGLGWFHVYERFPKSLTYQSLELIDPYFYHLDTCFCPLKDDYALIWPGAFKSIDDLHDLELLKVPEKDAKKFACNAVCFGNKVIIPSGCDETKRILNSAGFEVYDTDMSEYIKSGGACKCLTLRLE